MDDQIKLERLRNLSNKVVEWVELEGSVLSNKTKHILYILIHMWILFFKRWIYMEDL